MMTWSDTPVTPMPAYRRGFTLIELVIVIAVVAILLAVAVPSFQEQMAKSRRADAFSTLGQLQLAQEQWRASNPSYATAAQFAARLTAATNASEYYTYTLPASGATNYTIQAAPKGGQSGDRCGNLSLVYNAGATSRTASTGADRCVD